LNGCLAVSPTSRFLKFKYPRLKQIFYYDYIEWRPKKILTDLRTNYNWKIPEGLVTDWHSDCMFHVFKEYMFQNMIGASYTDSFLSNQVRYGLITREEAIEELKYRKTFYLEELKKNLKKFKLGQFENRINYSCFKHGNQKDV
jgi:hypothetical protein